MAESYMVVEFADDGLLAIIPENWWDVDGTGCTLWPPYKAGSMRMRNAARLREVPMDTWKSFPIRRIMYKTCKYIFLKYKYCLELENNSITVQ